MFNKLPLVFLSLFLFHVGCAPSTADHVDTDPIQQATPEPTPISHPMVARINAILQEGWNVTQEGNIIRITRREPVTLYNNIALPPRGAGLREVMENGRRVKYEITIKVSEFISRKEFREMADANEKTDRELRITRGAMERFASKGEFRPSTEQDRELYSEYQQELRDLPYHQLPDLYDSQNSYYISTTRTRRDSFSYQREERECRAVLGNIYSFADAYDDLVKAAAEDDFFDYPWDRNVDQAFISGRDYDSYVFQRKLNLPEMK